MEKNFVRVRSVWDIVISVAVIIIGCALMILPDSNGLMIAGFFVMIAGFVMLWAMKTSYKDETTGEKFCKKERFFPHSKQEQLMHALTSPTHFNTMKENEGNCLRLDVYYNRKKIYIQLMEYVPYTYEPCTHFYEYDISDGAKFIYN